MNEPKKIALDMSNIRMFDWQNLWWYDYEIDVGFDALSALIDNQEKTLKESIIITEKLRTEKLLEIPEEYKASYERHYFEHTDRVDHQLRIMQRYSSCLIVFSFIENSLKFLTSEFANKLNVEFKIPYRNIIGETMNFLINKLKIKKDALSQEFEFISNQKVIRNSIAHHNGIIVSDRLVDFYESEGINLKNGEIIIRPEYLKRLIENGRIFFKSLILHIDDRDRILSKIK